MISLLMMIVHLCLLVLFAYLIGSLSSAIIVCRLFGLADPRGKGSGNPGATNVLRIGGKVPAILTLLGDVIKGIIPVLLVIWYGSGVFELYTISAVMLSVLLGHLYPIFFRLQGGKGVATFLGVLLALSWQVGLLIISSWLAVFFLTRISSLSALIAIVLAPIFVYWQLGLSYVWAVAVMSLLVLYRHRENIQRLLEGKEKKVG